MINIPVPMAETVETVTLSRGDWEALIEALEDAADLAVVEAYEREVADGRVRVIPGEVVARLVEGETPTHVWRDYRGITQADLARQAGVSRSYLCEIEAGRKPGSAEALTRIARGLDVTVEDLLRRQRD